MARSWNMLTYLGVLEGGMGCEDGVEGGGGVNSRFSFYSYIQNDELSCIPLHEVRCATCL